MAIFGDKSARIFGALGIGGNPATPAVPPSIGNSGSLRPKWVVMDQTQFTDSMWQAFCHLKACSTGSIELGRDPERDICVKNSFVSGNHTKILYNGHDFLIKDRGSSNGTFINGKRLPLDRYQRFHVGDMLEIGKFHYVLPQEPIPIRMVGVCEAEPDPPAAPVIAPPPAPAPPVPPANKVIDKVEVEPEVAEIRDRIRNGGGLLFFTRNIDLKEFDDIAAQSKMRTNGGGVKFFRYGLGHEYGEEGAVLSVVMKRSFWEMEKDSSSLRNMFLDEVDGKPATGHIGVGTNGGGFFRAGYIGSNEDREGLLKYLATQAEYNRCLVKSSNNLPMGLSVDENVGMSVIGKDNEKYMGYYPQLEVGHDIELNDIECILVPEHMWDEIAARAQKNPELLGLLRKVEGTGKDEASFLEGREKLGRRTRYLGGSFQPNFGYDSFFKFEQEYFRIVGGAVPAAVPDFASETIALMTRYGYKGFLAGWLWAGPEGPDRLKRKENDWKIFVNPRLENFNAVLEEVLKELSARKESGIMFKTMPDPEKEWRPGRKFGIAPNTPKIVIYVNRDVLPLVLKGLEERLKGALKGAGFGAEPGPSFSRRYGSTDLLFYKMEYGEGHEERAAIAQKAEADARAAGISDEAGLMAKKKEMLEAAGFKGDNYYLREGDDDPMVEKRNDPAGDLIREAGILIGGDSADAFAKVPANVIRMILPFLKANRVEGIIIEEGAWTTKEHFSKLVRQLSGNAERKLIIFKNAGVWVDAGGNAELKILTLKDGEMLVDSDGELFVLTEDGQTRKAGLE